MTEDLNDPETFLRDLALGLPADERLILCGFVGDPELAAKEAWRPRPWAPGRPLLVHPDANAYVTVGSFRRAGDGSFRRRTETFCAGRALMVDDVGTKIPRDRTAAWPQPSWRIETSPGNEQWWYLLAEPERDVARFDGVIRAFISGALLGADPGMSGVTRVGRLPTFINGKRKYASAAAPLGFRVRALERAPVRYTTQQLLDGFGLRIMGRREPRERLTSEDALARNAAFADAYKFLGQRGMLKRREPDPSGWTEMSCPWVGEHTGGADTGAAVREPSPENDYYGAFRCHHGHCADRGWADLTDWIAELAGEELERAAQGAHQLYEPSTHPSTNP